MIVENDMVKLTTEDGNRVTNTIFLEPAVLQALIEWLERQQKASE